MNYGSYLGAHREFLRVIGEDVEFKLRSFRYLAFQVLSSGLNFFITSRTFSITGLVSIKKKWLIALIRSSLIFNLSFILISPFFSGETSPPYIVNVMTIQTNIFCYMVLFNSSNIFQHGCCKRFGPFNGVSQCTVPHDIAGYANGPSNSE